MIEHTRADAEQRLCLDKTTREGGVQHIHPSQELMADMIRYGKCRIHFSQVFALHPGTQCVALLSSACRAMDSCRAIHARAGALLLELAVPTDSGTGF